MQRPAEKDNLWTKAEIADDTSRRCDITTDEKAVTAKILV